MRKMSYSNAIVSCFKLQAVTFEHWCKNSNAKIVHKLKGSKMEARQRRKSFSIKVGRHKVFETRGNWKNLENLEFRDQDRYRPLLMNYQLSDRLAILPTSKSRRALAWELMGKFYENSMRRWRKQLSCTERIPRKLTDDDWKGSTGR